MGMAQYRMPSTGIRPGDIVTGHGKRNIRITEIKDARISYRGQRFSVRYLTGVNITTQRPVTCVAAHKGFWIVTRPN